MCVCECDKENYVNESDNWIKIKAKTVHASTGGGRQAGNRLQLRRQTRDQLD